jgi:hypothetical protein
MYTHAALAQDVHSVRGSHTYPLHDHKGRLKHRNAHHPIQKCNHIDMHSLCRGTRYIYRHSDKGNCGSRRRQFDSRRGDLRFDGSPSHYIQNCKHNFRKYLGTVLGNIHQQNQQHTCSGMYQQQ